MRFLTLVFTFFLVFPLMAMDYPQTLWDGTEDSYHGVKVEDPFRWLEDWSLIDVKAWSAEQNRIARQYLDALPGRAAIIRRVEKVNVGNKL